MDSGGSGFEDSGFGLRVKVEEPERLIFEAGLLDERRGVAKGVWFGVQGS